MTSLVWDILTSKCKTRMKFNGADNLYDALNFGISYIESEDHIVEYIMTSAALMKRIFAEIEESKVDLEDGCIGSLWTSRLLVSKKLKDDQILFSNSTFSVVIDVDTNPNRGV